VSYEAKGYWFRTPEAWDITGNYRASMYMRPAAIWAMEMTSPTKSSDQQPAAQNRNAQDESAKTSAASVGTQ
jgi:hypothetical protein